MRVSLQPTYSLANMKMKPKHCVSNSAYCNQTSEHQIHYTNSELFETALNNRTIAIGYVKWEEYVSCFRWRIHHPIGKYIVTKNICLWAVCQYETKYMEWKMRRIWWCSVCIGHFQQTRLNKFSYPYIHLVVSLIFPVDVNNLTDKLRDC